MQLLKTNLKAFITRQALHWYFPVLPVNDTGNMGSADAASCVTRVISGATQEPEIKFWQIRGFVGLFVSHILNKFTLKLPCVNLDTTGLRFVRNST